MSETTDVGPVHVLTADGTCRQDCPHPEHALVAAAVRVVDLFVDGTITAPTGDGPAALLALARAIPDEARGFRPKREFSPFAPDLGPLDMALIAEIEAADLPVWQSRTDHDA